jgi:hypothetical protein
MPVTGIEAFSLFNRSRGIKRVPKRVPNIPTGFEVLFLVPNNLQQPIRY